TQEGEGGRRQPAINLNRMFHHQKVVLGPLEQRDDHSADQAVDQDVSLHNVLRTRFAVLTINRPSLYYAVHHCHLCHSPPSMRLLTLPGRPNPLDKAKPPLTMCHARWIEF